ncbi:MAG: restriction endonuclease, partial [Bacteroidetes bacterium]|nr:restriction endonuclease [Bacteroidota bacterium]
EFIRFLPVLAYDGSSMKQIDPAGILDMAMSGTTATLLARRWESALLVNVDNFTLQRLMNNDRAMQALMSIEGFRSLNQDIETIINKSEAVKKAKREKSDDDLTNKEKKELTEAEKEYKSLRKQIQEKLIKFATRIPIFMYLTDYRERSLKDVITKLEPGLFKKVTGLDVRDFELLVSLGVF